MEWFDYLLQTIFLKLKRDLYLYRLLILYYLVIILVSKVFI